MSNEAMERAELCPKCGNAPINIIKTPEFVDKDGILREAVHEVGCIVCPPELVKDKDGKPLDLYPDSEPILAKRVSYSARALSLDGAIDKWNAGEYVEDYYFNRCPMTFGDLTINPR
jgi:hypothetical protein